MLSDKGSCRKYSGYYIELRGRRTNDFNGSGIGHIRSLFVRALLSSLVPTHPHDDRRIAWTAANRRRNYASVKETNDPRDARPYHPFSSPSSSYSFPRACPRQLCFSFGKWLRYRKQATHLRPVSEGDRG